MSLTFGISTWNVIKIFEMSQMSQKKKDWFQSEKVWLGLGNQKWGFFRYDQFFELQEWEKNNQDTGTYWSVEEVSICCGFRFWWDEACGCLALLTVMIAVKIIFFVSLPIEMKFRRASPGMGFLEPVQVLVLVCFQQGTWGYYSGVTSNMN